MLPTCATRRAAVVAAGLAVAIGLPGRGAGAAAQAVPEQTRAPDQATLSGAVTTDTPLYLSDDAVVTVRLLDVSKADAPAVKIAEIETVPKGAPPFAFQLPYPLASIDPRHAYAVAAEIRDEGAVRYRSRNIRVLTRGGTTFPVDVGVEPVVAPLPPPRADDGAPAPGGAAAPAPRIGDRAEVPQEALAGMDDAGWARDLPTLRRAIATCVAQRPSQQFHVRDATRTHGGVRLRLGTAHGARFECTISADETRVLVWRRLASDAPVAMGEGIVVFTPPGGSRPAGACYRQSRVVVDGAPAGLLFRKQC